MTGSTSLTIVLRRGKSTWRVKSTREKKYPGKKVPGEKKGKKVPGEKVPGKKVALLGGGATVMTPVLSNGCYATHA